MIELSFLSYLIFATNIGVMSIFLVKKQESNEQESRIKLDTL